jgi:hypothetical protein
LWPGKILRVPAPHHAFGKTAIFGEKVGENVKK